MAVLSVLMLAGGCATAERSPQRGTVIRQIVPSTVQLRCERDGGVRRAASGVLLARDVATSRAWVVTTRHFLEPLGPQAIYVHIAGKAPVSAKVVKVSQQSDLALLEISGTDAPAARLKDVVQLGDEVWVVAYPFGRRMTLSSGVVSQVAPDAGGAEYEGAARTVDVSVSYGASGGGVFEAETGALVGLVLSYRTARLTPRGATEAIEVPVPGDTTVVPAGVIRRFAVEAGLAEFLMP